MLDWKEYWHIAEALEREHPDLDLLNLREGDVLDLVRSLEGSGGENLPPPKQGVLDAVLYKWVSLRTPEPLSDFE